MTRERHRHPAHTAPAPESRTHYLIVGVALAGLWLLNRDKSLLFHAVQMLALMSAFTVLQIVLIRHVGDAPPYIRLVVAKLALVGLAVGAEWLLSPATSRSNAIVAAGLVVLITAVGPVLDRIAARRAASATRPTSTEGDPLLVSRKD